jgi:uncharacterized membrane protein
MKRFRVFVVNNLMAGFLVILPIYLAVLLLLKAAKSVAGLVRPIAALLPDWFRAEIAISFLLVLIVCFLVGTALRTSMGRAARTRIETSLFQKVPGYTLFRSMTRQLVGQDQESAWKPALAEIEDALVPAFIIEEFADGRFTVFVPSVPTPLAGAVYILSHERVHPLNVPFAQAVKTVTRWGSGSNALVAAMESERARSPEFTSSGSRR